MRIRHTAAVAVWGLVLGMVASSAPVLAGSEDDPEIEADCESSTTVEIRVGDEFVVCRAWFATVSAEAPSTADHPVVRGFRTTVRLRGDYEARERPGYVDVAWTNGACREAWSYADVLASSSTLRLHRHCGDDSVWTELPFERLEVDRTDVTVTVLDEDLAVLGSGVEHGSVLAAPTASSSFMLRGPGENVLDLAVGGGEAGPGRDYVVGSD